MFRTICFAFVLLTLLVGPVQAAATRIKVGIFPLEPVNFIDSAGTAQGLHPSLLREVARQEGWSLLFVPVSWSEGLEGLQNGKIDLMVSVTHTPERAEVMDYSSEPALEVWGQLFVRPDGQVEKLTDLNNQRVGIMYKDINGRNFQQMAKRLGIECSYTAYPNLADVLAATRDGRVSAGVSPQHFGLRHASNYDLVPSSIQFSPFPIFYTTKKGKNPRLLQQIDAHLNRWKQDKNSFYYQQLNQWLGGTGDQRAIIPKWLLVTLSGFAALALLLLLLNMLLKSQVKKSTAEVVKANQNLTQSEARYRNLIESMIQPMALHEIICDSHGKPVDYRYLDVNAAFEELLGRPAKEIIGKRGMELLPEIENHWIENYGKVALTGTPAHLENYSAALDRHFDVVAYSPAANQFAIVATDITARIKMQQEQKKLEEQVLHAQKLESLGVLAGGIAHDFNNILMAVLGHCELALRRLAKESPAKKNIEQIKSAANNAADLANQMLAYSGKGKFIVEPLDLSKIVDEMQQMLTVSVSKKAILRYEFTPNLTSVEADATQMRQVILNLVINASDAIGDKSGVIAITTGVMDCTQTHLQDAWLDEKLPAGQYVYLEVADTGCGMDKATVNRIFEPFFTTKFTGRGLGMAAVMGIVRGHHGAIKVYSEENKGSTFKVLLPAASKPAALFDTDQGTEQSLQTSGTVLLVDDDETVRSIGREMLEEFGYDVITADDGQDALEKFKAAQTAITFVLMDLTMPHMDGEQAFREIRRIDPKAKVIMSSGYNEQEVSQKFAGKGICGFLKKPYQLSALQNAIQNLPD